MLKNNYTFFFSQTIYNNLIYFTLFQVFIQQLGLDLYLVIRVYIPLKSHIDNFLALFSDPLTRYTTTHVRDTRSYIHIHKQIHTHTSRQIYKLLWLPAIQKLQPARKTFLVIYPYTHIYLSISIYLYTYIFILFPFFIRHSCSFKCGHSIHNNPRHVPSHAPHFQLDT